MMGYPVHPLYRSFLAFLTCVQTNSPLEMNFVCVDGFFEKLFMGQPNFGFFLNVIFNKAMLGFSVSWSSLNVAWSPYLNFASYDNVEKILNSFQFEDIVMRNKPVDSFTRFETFFFLFSFSRVSLNLKIVIDSTLTFAMYKLVIDGTIGLNSSKKDIWKKKKGIFVRKVSYIKGKTPGTWKVGICTCKTEGLHNSHLFLSTAQFLYYVMRKRITSRDLIGCKACVQDLWLWAHCEYLNCSLPSVFFFFFFFYNFVVSKIWRFLPFLEWNFRIYYL